MTYPRRTRFNLLTQSSSPPSAHELSHVCQSRALLTPNLPFFVLVSTAGAAAAGGDGGPTVIVSDAAVPVDSAPPVIVGDAQIAQAAEEGPSRVGAAGVVVVGDDTLPEQRVPSAARAAEETVRDTTVAAAGPHAQQQQQSQTAGGQGIADQTLLAALSAQEPVSIPSEVLTATAQPPIVLGDHPGPLLTGVADAQYVSEPLAVVESVLTLSQHLDDHVPDVAAQQHAPGVTAQNAAGATSDPLAPTAIAIGASARVPAAVAKQQGRVLLPPTTEEGMDSPHVVARSVTLPEQVLASRETAPAVSTTTTAPAPSLAAAEEGNSNTTPSDSSGDKQPTQPPRPRTVSAPQATLAGTMSVTLPERPISMAVSPPPNPPLMEAAESAGVCACVRLRCRVCVLGGWLSL